MPVTFANKGCCGILVISHRLPDPDSEPWGAQEGEKGAFLSHPQWCTLRRLRTGRNWILVLSSQGAYQRNKFKESRLLHLPILRKALKKKFEMYYFLLLTVIFWCSDYPGLFVCFWKTPLYSGSLLTSLEQSLRAFWEVAGIKSSGNLPNKT